MNDTGGATDTDDADHYPKDIKHRIRMVFFQDGTPRQDNGIQRIEAPDEEKRTLGTHPAHQAEAEDAHKNADHLDHRHVLDDIFIQIEAFLYLIIDISRLTQSRYPLIRRPLLPTIRLCRSKQDPDNYFLLPNQSDKQYPKTT